MTAFGFKLTLAAALGWLVALPALPAQAHDPLASEGCGASHASDVREILRFRDPGAAPPGFDDESTLALDRALIIDDFLRLKAVDNPSLNDGVRFVDDALLRRMRDSGGVTAEVCAVVRFMHGYYAGGKRAPGKMPDVAAAPPPLQVESADVATPRPARVAREVRGLELQRQSEERARRRERARAAEARAAESRAAESRAAESRAAEARAAETRAAAEERAAEVPPAPSPEPAVPSEEPGFDVAAIERDQFERERREAQDAEIRRSAQSLIAELQQQLAVPRYLSFREARTQTPVLANEELEARQVASLQATERVVVLLVRLASEPSLRDAVQAALGKDGRRRVEQSIEASFKSVPDVARRERARRLWAELEAAASVKR